MYAFVFALLILAFGVIQTFIGGARLVFSLPAYAILALAGIATALPAWRGKAALAPRPWCTISALALAAYVSLRCLVSPVPYLARNDLFMVLGALVTYLIVAVFLTAVTRRMAFVGFLIAFATVHLLVGVVQFSQDNNFMLIPWIYRVDYGARASGFYICPNHLAGLLEMLAMLGAALCFWGRGGVLFKVATAYAAAACLAGVALTGSRGGYLSTLVGMLAFGVISGWFVFWVRRKQFLVYALAGLCVLAITVGAGLFLMGKSQALTQRVDRVYDPTNMRIYLWQAAIKEFELQPIFGTGAGTFFYWGRHFRTPEVQNDPGHAHEDYLELLAEYGVVGEALLLFFLGAHLYSGFRGLRRIVHVKLKPSKRCTSNEAALIIGSEAALAALLAHSFIDFNLHVPANTLFVAFLFGILANPTEVPGRAAVPQTFTPLWLRLIPAGLGLILFVSAVPLIKGEYYGERARAALRDAQYPDTIAFAEKALVAEKKNADLYFYLAEAHRFLGLQAKTPVERQAQYRETVEALRSGITVFPQDLRLRLKLGLVLDNMGQFAESEKLYAQAVTDDPNLGKVYAYYGLHMQLQHRYNKAAALYHKAEDLSELEISSAGLRDLEAARKYEKNVLSEIGIQPAEDEDDDTVQSPPSAK